MKYKDTNDFGENSQRADWKRLTKGLSVLKAEPSRYTADDAIIAADDSAEDRQRMEWRLIVAGIGASAAEPSPDFTDRVISSVAAEARKAHHSRKFLRIAAAAAAVIAFAVLLPRLAIQQSSRGGIAHTSLQDLPHTTSKHPISTQDRNPAAKALANADDATDWLVERQNPDGSWSPSSTGGSEIFKPALTALTLMALDRHAPLRHSEAISKAASALVAMQRGDGSFGGEGLSSLYNHAFATFALAELDANGNDYIREAISKAVAYSESIQNSQGAWGGDEGDAAISIWELGAMLKARNAGYGFDSIALRRGLAWLKRQSAQGLLDFRKTLDRPDSSATGSIMLTLLATDEIVAAAKDFPALGSASGNIKASCDAAFGRYAIRALDGNDGEMPATVQSFLERRAIYSTAVTLLGWKRP